MNKQKVVLLNDSSSDHHYGCSRVVSNLKILIQQSGGEIIHSLKISEPIDNPKTRAALSKADIVIINGEGTFHHGALRAQQMLQLVHEYSLDKYLVNATYDSNPNSFAEYLKTYKAISVRETKSQQTLIKYNISSTVLPDLSFYSDSLFNEHRSGYLYGDSVNEEVSWQILQYFRTKSNFSINQIHFYGKPLKQSIVYFFKSLRKKRAIKYNIRRAFYQKHQTSPEAYHQSIARSEGIVTGRYHAVCFAVNSQTPFLAVSSNSHKIEGLLEDIGLKGRIIAQEKIKEVETVTPFNESERDSIVHYVTQGRANIQSFYQQILSQ